MKKLILTSVLVMGTLLSVAQAKSAATTSIKKVSAKDVRAIMDTTTVPLIINFWASWCGPCIREIPWFDSIIEKKNLTVKLILVSLDFATEYPQQLTAFVKKQGYKGEVVFLNETTSDYFIPIIDKKWTGEIPASIFVNNSKKYYRLYNQQLPPKKFELELEKLVKGALGIEALGKLGH